jgi:hypothetical protein
MICPALLILVAMEKCHQAFPICHYTARVNKAVNLAGGKGRFAYHLVVVIKRKGSTVTAIETAKVNYLPLWKNARV